MSIYGCVFLAILSCCLIDILSTVMARMTVLLIGAHAECRNLINVTSVLILAVVLIIVRRG